MKQKKLIKMLKDNRAPAWAMYYGACATSGHDYQNREQDHNHTCSRWSK